VAIVSSVTSTIINQHLGSALTNNGRIVWQKRTAPQASSIAATEILDIKMAAFDDIPAEAAKLTPDMYYTTLTQSTHIQSSKMPINRELWKHDPTSEASVAQLEPRGNKGRERMTRGGKIALGVGIPSLALTVIGLCILCRRR
jgi:hypothetical protein